MLERGIKPVGDADFLRRIQGRLAELERDLPEEYDEPEASFDCEFCKDRGVILLDVPVHDARYGKLVACPTNCRVVQENRKDRVQRMLEGMKKRTIDRPDKKKKRKPAYFADYRIHTLDDDGLQAFYGDEYAMFRRDFETDVFDQILRGSGIEHNKQHCTDVVAEQYDRFLKGNTQRHVALEIAQRFVRDLYISGPQGKTKYSMVLAGPNGSGKTFLAQCIRAEFIRSDVPAWYTRLRDLLRNVQAAYDKKVVHTADDMIEFYGDFPVLIIDEFDIHKKSEDRMDIVEDIINYRYENDMPTVVTTNLSPDDLQDAWGFRIHSRLVDMGFWFWLSWDLRDKSQPHG